MVLSPFEHFWDKRTSIAYSVSVSGSISVSANCILNSLGQFTLHLLCYEDKPFLEYFSIYSWKAWNIADINTKFLKKKKSWRCERKVRIETLSHAEQWYHCLVLTTLCFAKYLSLETCFSACGITFPKNIS